MSGTATIRSSLSPSREEEVVGEVLPRELWSFSDEGRHSQATAEQSGCLGACILDPDSPPSPSLWSSLQPAERGQGSRQMRSTEVRTLAPRGLRQLGTGTQRTQTAGQLIRTASGELQALVCFCCCCFFIFVGVSSELACCVSFRCTAE